MTNGKVRFFSVAIAGILAGCSALGGIFGDGKASKTERNVFPSEVSPQTSQETTPRPAAAPSTAVVIVETHGNTPTPKQTTSGTLSPTARPTISSTPTPFPCPSDRTRMMIGRFNPLSGNVGRALYFEPRCDYSDQDRGEEPVAPASIGDHLWIFMGKINEYATWFNIFRMDQVNTDGSAIFSRRQGDIFGSSSGYNFLYDFYIPDEGGQITLPGDVESRASSSLTFTEQGKSRFGSPTFEWPCAQGEEYGGTQKTQDNPDPPDLSSPIFAVGDRYIVRSVGAYQYELDGNGERWLTIRKVIQAIRRDGHSFKVIRKYQLPYDEVWSTYKLWAMDGGSWGMDSFVWSVQLKAFVRNPYEFGLVERRHSTWFEVLTEGDLDTLLAANEGSPCGIE